MPTYPTGYKASDAILTVRNRTGQTAGQPTDITIQSFLNAGIESVERRIGAIYASNNIAVSAPAQSVALPADMQQLINVNFSVSLPTASNAILYPIRIVQEGAFERLAGYAPGITGGYPTTAFIQSDASGVMTLQIFPVVNTNGYINVYYIQRPQIWTDTSNSVTQLDSMVQEAVILEACKRTCEARAMYGEPVKYFMSEYEKALEQIKEDVGRRIESGPQVVVDASQGVFNSPYWYNLDF